jgi:hypothetical protein
VLILLHNLLFFEDLLFLSAVRFRKQRKVEIAGMVEGKTLMHIVGLPFGTANAPFQEHGAIIDLHLG